MFTDTHCHLSREYYDSYEEIIENAKQSGVNGLINSGCSHDANIENIELVDKYENVFATLGLHPSVAHEVTEEMYEFIEKNLNNPKVLAIGEIGLDYHYGKEYIEEQKKCFRRQLKQAEEKNIPVVIHSRDATKETIDILKEFNVKGVIHSFSGSLETAKEYIKMGFILGINGVITFKNSNLSEVIDKLDLSYIVLETDSPYLTPTPFRGKRNEPKYISEIADFICKLKGITREELARITNENIKRIFDK